MKRKYNSVNEETGQPIAVKIFVLFFIFMLLMIVAIIFPVYSGDYIYVSVLVGSVGFASFVWMQVQFNLYARFFATLSFSGLLALIACRAFGYLFPHLALFGVLGITSIVLFSYALPMWNLTLANFIREELTNPKTKFGRILYRWTLLIVPGIGVVIAVINFFLRKNNEDGALPVMFLVISVLVAIIMPFGSRSPNSPWERDLLPKNS